MFLVQGVTLKHLTFELVHKQAQIRTWSCQLFGCHTLSMCTVNYSSQDLSNFLFKKKVFLPGISEEQQLVL